MPTISFNYADFEKLLGRKLPVDKFRDLALMYAKAEVDDYNSLTSELKLSLDDTNLPYLWCVEGLARFFRGVLGIETGLHSFKVSTGSYKVVVEKSVKKYRPFIATFVANGKKIDKYLLEQLIQLQEKFCDGYGRKRQKVSIGLYSHSRIKFPVHYKSVEPGSVFFAPLESQSKMDLNEILCNHPKGKQYGWILSKFDRYPILVDSNDEVLSLIPIINSNFTGKLMVGDSEIFFEATGTDEESVNLAANIFAANLSDRGFGISGVVIDEGSRKFSTPKGFASKVKVLPSDVEKLTGLTLSTADIRKLLEMGRYAVSGSVVTVPNYRRDILHIFDVVEDVAIMYGFDRIESAPLGSYTVGEPTDENVFVDRVREICVGLGFQEILSPVLSNKTVLEVNMEGSHSGIVEIDNVMSDTFSAVRNWLTPLMIEVLSKNKHNDYPQKVFEQGIVNIRSGSRISNIESLALAVSHTKADFTETKQYLDAILGSLGVSYTLKQLVKGCFIHGRAGSIQVEGKTIGHVGEISPKVLANWQLGMPVAVLELDLTEIMKFTSNS